MKIAFSSSADKGLESQLDPRFGRAKAFIILDPDSEEFTIIDNDQNLNATQGAGVQAAQNVVSCGPEVLITGHCGPKAFRALGTAGIKIFYSNAATIADALKDYRDGKLNEATGADVEGHW